MASNYFEQKTTHPRANIETFLKDGGLASKIKREDPALYSELRQDARTLGLLGESRRESNARIAAPMNPAKERPLTNEIRSAISVFSKERCEKLFRAHAGSPESAELAAIATSPDVYAQLQLAARHFGVTADHSDSVRFNYTRGTKQESEPGTKDLPKPAPGPAVKFAASGEIIGYE